jgi:hypothetical protein
MEKENEGKVSTSGNKRMRKRRVQKGRKKREKGSKKGKRMRKRD